MSSTELDPDLIAPAANFSNIEVNKTFEVGPDIYNPKGLLPEPYSINDGPLGDQISRELPQASIDFKIIDENKSKIVSLKQIEDVLLNNKTISQEQARWIDEKIPGFLKNSYDIERFTPMPSKAGFDKALRFVQEEIKSTALESFSNVQKNLLDAFVNDQFFIQKFINEDLESFIYDIEKFSNDLSLSLDKIKNNPNAIFYDTQNNLHNFIEDQIASFKNIDYENQNTQKDTYYRNLLDIAKSLQGILEKNALAQFIQMLLDGKTEPNLYYRTQVITAGNEELINIGALLNFYSQGQVFQLARSIFSYYSTYVNEQQKTQTALLDLTNQDEVTISYWYVENEEAVKQFITTHHKLKALIILLGALQLGLKTFTDTLSQSLSS